MRDRRLALPAYLLCCCLVTFSLVDSAGAVWPVHASEVEWRFNANALFSRSLIELFIGIFLAFGIAIVYDQKRVLRAIAYLATALAATFMVASLLFVMDAAEVIREVTGFRIPAFRGIAVATMLRYLMGTLVALSVAYCARHLGTRRRPGTSSHGRTGPGEVGTRGLLVVSDVSSERPSIWASPDQRP